jgi:shikimate kinase
MAPKIILIGPMGSGKTTIGRLLAEYLELPFRDTDLLIESQTGRTVSDIFLEDGEDSFRVIEKAVLRAELLSDNTVLALGGGAPISFDAQSALRAIASPVIYLDISLASVAPRIGFNRDRPLLLNNPRGQWETLMQERRPIYESISDLIIDVNGRNESEIVAEILKEIA